MRGEDACKFICWSCAVALDAGHPKFMANLPPDLSVVIPCYRDAPHLRANVESVIRVLQGTRHSFEIILVNDASPDRDREIILELMTDFPEFLRMVDHPVNTGRGRAVTDGMLEARGKYTGFLDIDLEVAAHYIAPLVAQLEDGADVACAHRIYRTTFSLVHRAVLSMGYSRLVRAMLREDLADTEAGFKFFRRERILPVLSECKDPGWFWDTEIMVRAKLAGLRIAFLPVLFLRNPDKSSTVRIWHDSVTYWKRLMPFRREVEGLRRATRL